MVIGIFTDGAGTVARLGLGMKPESNPPGSAMQGVLKVDCVRVWLSSKKLKMITSPTAALTKLGIYSLLIPPTVTCTAN